MKIRKHRWALCITIAVLGAVIGPAVHAQEERREPREPRDIQRQQRDLERARERELRNLAREQEDLLDRSGSDSGSDDFDSHGEDGEGDDGERDRDEADEGDENEEERESRGSSRRGAQRFDVERGAGGADRQRAEVLLVGPDDSSDAIRRAGYTVLSEQRLESLRQSLVRIRIRDGESIEQMIEALRALAPGARVAPNHIFHPSASSNVGDVQVAPMAGKASVPATIGIIDTGADDRLARLAPVILARRGFAPGGYQARAHGTAVAQLAASMGSRLAVADVFGLDGRNQLVAPADLIASAIDWMLAQRVRVVNISIEGPRNEVLEFVVQGALAQGVAIVAAAGNGGPAAPPAYPAAYPGVIAVTALDERGRAYRRAARGSHVQFAARGSFDTRQSLVETDVKLQGTSFAAPLVSAAVANHWKLSPAASREEILERLRQEAVDLGAPGRDAVFGWGRID